MNKKTTEEQIEIFDKYIKFKDFGHQFKDLISYKEAGQLIHFLDKWLVVNNFDVPKPQYKNNIYLSDKKKLHQIHQELRMFRHVYKQHLEDKKVVESRKETREGILDNFDILHVRDAYLKKVNREEKELYLEEKLRQEVIYNLFLVDMRFKFKLREKWQWEGQAWDLLGIIAPTERFTAKYKMYVISTDPIKPDYKILFIPLEREITVFVQYSHVDPTSGDRIYHVTMYSNKLLLKEEEVQMVLEALVEYH